MEMERKIYKKLQAWKQSHKRKVFLLLGARQTGKTYAIRTFAEQNYDHLVEVNFLDDKENAQLLANASGAQDLISRLTLVVGHEIQPNTLVFFDEVQQLGQDAVTLSKFIVEDGRFDLVISGSLLGTVLEGVTSFPVGYAVVERMYPLDFEEFCWARGVPESILDTVKKCFENRVPMEESLHKRLINLYRQYIVVGGMPEAVSTFIESGLDLGAAREVATEISSQYRFDIIKYAPDRKPNILSIYDNLAAQLSKANKRFVLNSIKKGATKERLEDDFAWLSQAGVALSAYVVTEPKKPLIRTKNQAKFKLYSSDVGVLLSNYSEHAAKGVVDGAGDANYGAVYENVVAQELAAAGFPLYYYNNNRKGEVDFLLENKDGNVVPIEVKSGKDYKVHAALNNLMSTDEYNIEYAYVLSEENVSQGQRSGRPVYYLPLYMTMCLVKEKGTNLANMKLEEITF